MKEVEKFLLNNGFVQDEYERSIYRGKKCNVRIFHDHYAVVAEEWPDVKELGFLHSRDLNIYWLVGVLTWYGLIPKDYNGGLES